MTPNDLNTIKWYSSIQERNDSQKRATGPKYNLIASIYRFPPFDFTFDPTGGSITYFRLHSLEDGSITNIIQPLVDTGLSDNQESNQGSPFDAYRYPSGVNAPLGITPGVYYAEIHDNASGIWYTDDILFVDDVDKMVTLEWWHMEKFKYAGRFIKYDYPFKHRCVFPTEIGKPIYQINKQGNTRDGKFFPSQTVSYKEHRFWFIAPEHLLDALRVVDQHDCKQIKHKGKTYDVDEIRWNIDWVADGNIAHVECIFITDTVAVVNGRKLSSKIYGVEDGGCLSVAHTALGVITEGERVFNGSPIEDGDIFVIQGMALEEKTLKAYNATTDSFDAVAIAGDAIVYVANISTYYIQKTYLQGPEITTVNSSPWSVQGIAFPNTTVEVWLRDDSGNEWLAAVGTRDEFEGAGISFDPGDATEIEVRLNSTKCEDLAKSGWRPFDEDGIGFMIIEGGPPTNRVG